MADLFIPKKMRAGFQNRNATVDGKLSYITYFDIKGKLRKEHSWNEWRDDKIPFEDFDNVPTSGFVLNKSIKRYDWGHFSSNRSYIRIYDPRGYEFEITPENLIGLLMESNCSKREIDTECVYAMSGKDLVLIPCISEAYTNAVEHTKRKSEKVSAKSLKAGCSYTSKNGDEFIYIGKYDWYQRVTTHSGYRSHWGCEKQYIFKSVKENIFVPTKNLNALAHINSEEEVVNFAEIMDEFNKSVHSSDIKEHTFEKIKEDVIENIENLKKSFYFVSERKKDNSVDLLYIYDVYNGSRYISRHGRISLVDENVLEIYNSKYYYNKINDICGFYYEEKISLDELKRMLRECYTIKTHLKNGIIVDDLIKDQANSNGRIK